MSNRAEITKGIKSILDELRVEYLKVIIFGSKARGDFGEESDWDFLVILKKPRDVNAKKELWLKIYRKFHEYFPFTSADIILKDAESFEKEKKIANTISNEVYLEGVEI